MIPWLLLVVLVTAALLLFGPGGWLPTVACFALATEITALLVLFGTGWRTALWSIPIVLTGIGFLRVAAEWLPSPLVSRSDLSKEDKEHKTLFVLVHGISVSPVPGPWVGPEKALDGVCEAVADKGDVLVVRYPSFLLSNADPEDVAVGVSEQVETACDEGNYDKIVLVGHSIGAPIAPRHFCLAWAKPMGAMSRKKLPILRNGQARSNALSFSLG